MLRRTNQWLFLFAGALVSQFALAVPVIIGYSINSTQSFLTLPPETGTDTGVQNNATVHSLTVSGSAWIGTSLYGLYNTAGNLIDANGFKVTLGSTVFGGTAGIQNGTGATITTTAPLGAINNAGTVGQNGLLLSTNGIYNLGTISGTSRSAIYNTGVIAGSNAAILNDTGATISSTGANNAISNLLSGTMGGTGATYGIYNAGTISASASGYAVANIGTLTGTTAGLYNNTGATISGAGNVTVSNSGTLGGAASQYGIYNLGTISNTAGNNAIVNQSLQLQGTIAGIYNGATGIISASGAGVGISNPAGTISSITNLGSINATTGIRNGGTLTALNNLQGGGSPLTYVGTLPTNYNVIANSISAYGKLSGSSLTGTTTFGVTPTSALVVNTYTAVLSGFATANLANQVGGTVTGTLGGLGWTLSPETGSPSIWDLVVVASTPTPDTSPTPAPTPTPTPTPAPPPPPTNMTQGSTFGLASVGVTTNPVFDGGTLTLSSGASTAQPFTVTSSGGTITTPSGSSATMTGGLTGTGPMTFNGGGTLVLGGASTYTGGTTVSDNTTLSIEGSSPLGSGAIFIASGSSLSGTGSINAPVTVAGSLHPGNSPGYLALTQPITFNAGATYQQDIAGTAQASATSLVGATGYYSFLQVAGAGVTINPGATLTPRLQNLFSPSESGYGSAPYVPVVGDKFRILTADGGITGKFTTLTQPAGLDPATQFLSFYNYNSSNSLDLAVIPASFNTAVASSSGNKNAQSVASALDKMVVANQASTSTAAQDALLFTASGQSLASLPSFTQGMAGEIYGATLAVVPQTSQRVQQAVISRLGDTMTAPVMAGAMAAVTNTAISATNPGGQPTASMSSNPNVNPYASGSGGMSMSNGAAWGEVAYQYGNRASDSNSGGWSSNLVQAVVGVDMYSAAGTKAGGGVALSNTNVSASQSSGTVQQGSLFLYGKLPVQQFVVDAMASYGFNSTNNSRNDATGITTGLQAKNVQGNDALVSLGLNLPIDMAESRVTPYIRATWQQVNQNGFNEGSAASALTVNSFNGNGVRGVIGVAAGSKALDPIKEQYTYRVNVGLGADSTNVLNPQLNASLAGMTTTINTPGAGAAFVQAGMYGTIKFADNAFAYAGVTAEARSGQVLAGGNIGVRVQF